MSNINLETIRIGGRCEKHVSMLPCVQCDNERLRAALEKAEQERDQYREETRWQGRRIRELTDERAALEAQEPFAYCVIDPDGGSLEYSAQWPEACHEHINDCITEHDIEGAGKWIVRPLFAAAGAEPVPVRLIEAAAALLSNEDHAVSAGINRGYQEGSQTWECWQELREAMLAAASKGAAS